MKLYASIIGKKIKDTNDLTKSAKSSVKFELGGLKALFFEFDGDGKLTKRLLNIKGADQVILIKSKLPINKAFEFFNKVAEKITKKAS